MLDHISIHDLANGNIFVGDAIGMKWLDNFTVCNANSSFWNEKDFWDTLERLKETDFKSFEIIQSVDWNWNDYSRN
jgi:hypothetical protein